MLKEKIFNIPNLLSFYRLLVFPVILYFVYTGDQKLFSVFLCISLVTDILDGLIARLFKLQTNFGAKLDSIADLGTFILAFCGVFKFKWAEFSRYEALIDIFLAAYILPYAVSVLRFRLFPSLHLYSVKIGAYIQGIFFFVLFFSGFYTWLFITAMCWGICSYLEETIIILLIPELVSDCRGLYWIRKAGHNK